MSSTHSSSIYTHKDPALLVDLVFPSSLAKWRQVITRSFIDMYSVDILVFKVNFFLIEFSVDYEDMAKYMSLHLYDIYVFDSVYAHLNEYNDDDFFDGLKYIGKYAGSYLFRRKEHRSMPIDFTCYKFAYFILWCCWQQFVMSFSLSPKCKQIVHLFPGGGYRDTRLIQKMPKYVHIISTQEFTSRYIIQHDTGHTFTNIFTGPYIDRCEVIPMKHSKLFVQSVPLRVCFTTIGDLHEKGAFVFDNIAKAYRMAWPDDPLVEFYSIGRQFDSNYVTSKGILSQWQVDKLYEDDIHILINPHSCQSEVIGFPHGTEALVRGVLLFTTDPNDLNHKNGFHFQDELYIIQSLVDLSDIVSKIHFYSEHRDVLQQNSALSQQRAMTLFGYENTMSKINAFIDDL